jgi:nucleoside-diphosphate-sugar epimerase
MKTALICGAGGFIGSHLVRRLKEEGTWVRGVDLKRPEFWSADADEFVIADLRDRQVCSGVIDRPFDEVYQLAADMGGAGYIFAGVHDAEIMSNSASINLNVLAACGRRRIGRLFYASSACIYPRHNQNCTDRPITSEASAYPAAPDSEYGWEKLFSERLYMSHARNFGINCRIARYHNVFGPYGAWRGGREKAPAALCRKVVKAADGDLIEIWGDGLQTRSFLFIDECIEGTVRLMRSAFAAPVNIGSDEMVSINQLAAMIGEIAGKDLKLKHVPGPAGVRGRTSDNTLIREQLGWAPAKPLRVGLAATYRWIQQQVQSEQVACND